MLRNRIYYNIKPFVPQTLRTAIRRRLALRRKQQTTGIWPIMPGSERPPARWKGWPEGKRFAVVLTHDVEGLAGLEKTPALIDLEIELGFRSAFNFVPEGGYQVPAELRRKLTANNFEVGVHDLKHDGRLFQSLAQFTRHASSINRYLREWQASGFRSGFMLHNLEWLHQLEIEYDMSTFDTDPFEPQPEGRHTIFPFWVSGQTPRNSSLEALHIDTPGDGYIELPYTLPQDSTLFLVLGEKSNEIWKSKVDWIAKHGGMVLIDTHPDYMNFEGMRAKDWQYPVTYYRDLLNYLRSNYADQYWHVLPREVARYSRPSLQTAAEEIQPATFKEPAYSPSLVASRGVSQDADSFGSVAKPGRQFQGKRAAVVLFSYFPADPRPRRAAEALAEEGMAVDVICLRRDRIEARRETFNGIRVCRLPLTRRRGSKFTYLAQYSTFILRSFSELTRRCLRQRYDLVHIHNMPDVLVFAALVAKLTGAKIILDLHDPMPELMQAIFGLEAGSGSVRFLKYLEKLSIAFADHAITVNRACQRIYTSRSCSPDKITVVMNAPDETVFQFEPPYQNGANGKNLDSAFSILYHGSLVQRNGFDLAVDALELIKERIPEARLVVCGERSSFFEQVMASVSKRGLADKIDYQGVKNHQGIAETIRTCDLGIIPNHRNTFTDINTPTRIFEYLSLGKPVVAPRTLGIEDYFEKDGLLFFQPGDCADLARQIEFAYFNRDRLPQIVEQGQKVYLANNWTRQRANLVEAIDRLWSR